MPTKSFFLTLILSLGLFLHGCIKSFHEKRVGEELWEVGYTDIEVCDKAAAPEKCISTLKPKILEKGQELCGKRLDIDLSACEKTQRAGLYAVVCRVQCKEKAVAQRSIPIRIAETEETSFEQSAGQLRVIVNSNRIKSLFSGTGIASVMKLDKSSYLLTSDKGTTCVKAETQSSTAGDVTLKAADIVECTRVYP